MTDHTPMTFEAVCMAIYHGREIALTNAFGETKKVVPLGISHAEPDSQLWRITYTLGSGHRDITVMRFDGYAH
jgi:hypothetical protein